jgi:adenylate kinase family enzyme
MPNYQDGKVYMIWAGDDIYYGSTTETLSRRLVNHKTYHKSGKKKCSSSIIFDKYGIENCKIELVELFPCNSREELNAREGFYVRNNNCVNKRVEGRTKQEYLEDKKEEIQIKRKVYHKKTYEKTKKPYICVCGWESNTTTSSIKKHEKSKKHKSFISQS